MLLASSGNAQNFNRGGQNNMMNSLGMIQVPQMAQSSHGIYPASNNATGTPHIIDESTTAAVDNTMQQLLNQS